MKVCVLREMRPGDSQLVPLSEVQSVTQGETIFVGDFSERTEKHGPSGSHSRTVCLPIGQAQEYTVCRSTCRPCRDGIRLQLQDGQAINVCRR